MLDPKKYSKKIFEWRTLRQKELNKKTRDWRKKLRYEVLSHYSGEQPKCAKCGIADIRLLVLDHINNDGAKERKFLRPDLEKGANSIMVYSLARKNNFPPNYQILCYNCNMLKHFNFLESK